MKILESVIYSDFEFDKSLVLSEEDILKLKEEGIDIKNKYPGMWLEEALIGYSIDCDVSEEYLLDKLAQSCRKLCMMYYASEKARKAEADFYSKTFKDTPVLE